MSDEPVELNHDEVHEWLRARRRYRAADREYRRAEDNLLHRLGDADAGAVNGMLAVERVRDEWIKIDCDALRAERPDIARQYGRERKCERLRMFRTYTPGRRSL